MNKKCSTFTYFANFNPHWRTSKTLSGDVHDF